MDNLFDLQDKEFREFLLKKLPIYCFYQEDSQFIADFIINLPQSGITPRLALDFYLKFSRTAHIDNVILACAFDYKMSKISNEKYVEFLNILINRNQISLTKRLSRNMNFMNLCNKFGLGAFELANIFMDEV